MIPFIFIIIATLYILLIIGFIIENKTVVSILGLGLVTTGIYTIINGYGVTDGILPQVITMTNVYGGFYIIFRSNIEQMQEVL